MDDLTAASLDDVREWFKRYYGAANATLAIAGDVQPKEVLAKVEKYFGDIPSGPLLQRQKTWIAKRTGTHRQVAQDRVRQARLYQVWNIPQFGSADGDYLTLAADVLAGGKSSRLYKRLVFDEQIASGVDASAELNEIGGRFYIVATARPGLSIEKVERAVNEEMPKFLAETGQPRMNCSVPGRKSWRASCAGQSASVDSAASRICWRRGRCFSVIPPLTEYPSGGQPKPRSNKSKTRRRSGFPTAFMFW